MLEIYGTEKKPENEKLIIELRDEYSPDEIRPLFPMRRNLIIGSVAGRILLTRQPKKTAWTWRYRPLAKKVREDDKSRSDLVKCDAESWKARPTER